MIHNSTVGKPPQITTPVVLDSPKITGPPTKLVAKNRRFLKMPAWQDVNGWSEDQILDVTRMSKCLEARGFSAEFRDIRHAWVEYSSVYDSVWTEFVGDESIDSLLFFLTEPWTEPEFVS